MQPQTSLIHDTVDFLLDLIFPRLCIGCNTLGTYLCPTCARTVKFFKYPLCPACGKAIPTLGVHQRCRHRTPVDGLVAVAEYDGYIRDLIAEVKYFDHFDMVVTLAKLLKIKFPHAYQSATAFVPVPLHPKRQFERGYNQSELLAKRLSAHVGIPTFNLLQKTRNTHSQVQLPRKERVRNVQDAFVCTKKLKHSYTFILIDDVSTTGTTLGECAQALKQAGAGTVYGFVVAHGV